MHIFVNLLPCQDGRAAKRKETSVKNSCGAKVNGLAQTVQGRRIGQKFKNTIKSLTFYGSNINEFHIIIPNEARFPLQFNSAKTLVTSSAHENKPM